MFIFLIMHFHILSIFSFFKDSFFLNYVYVSMHVNAGTCGSQKRVLDPLELKLDYCKPPSLGTVIQIKVVWKKVLLDSTLNH